jgi:site-specific DNA-methyltransferase (adenine-specific)|tara:strand:- start:636 stop:1388 length:753 start_codon:yes stop_codon:yes gene_type:complete
MIEIKNENCIDFLKSLPDNSVGHINADPPYNIGYDGGDDWDTFPSEKEYLDWCKEWIAECERVLQPNRMLCVWGTQKSDTFLRLKLDVLNATNLTAQSAIHWSYNWGGRPKNNFAHKFETAWCYSKGQDFYFDRTKVEVPRKMKKNIRTGQPYTNGTIPTTIWEGNLATVSKESQESKFHPTVKPQFILQRMINAYTKVGEVVCDPFSGSGSTAIASIKTNREFVGSELSEEYYKKSLERIQKHDPMGLC